MKPETYAGIGVPTVEQIKKICCDVFGVETFIVEGRKQDAKVPRQVFCYLVRKFTPITQTNIGEMIHRTHSTVISSIKLVEHTYLNDRYYGPYVEQCENLVNQVIIDYKDIDKENPDFEIKNK